MIREKLPLPRTDDEQPEDSEDGASTSSHSDDGEEESETRTVTVEYDRSDEAIGTVPAIHQSLVAPSAIERTPAAIRTGDWWATTLWAGEYPDAPMDGFLEEVYAAAETRTTDVSIHLDPRDTQATLDTLENRIEDLQADFEYLTEKHRASSRGVEKDLADHEELYDVLRNTPMEAFDVSTYLAVR
ncbi:MAG: transfer complex protein, partial [Halorhabdus sp.]